MYQCDICGRDVKKKIRLKGYTLCSKHMHQLLNHGTFLDNIPRTIRDLNSYRFDGDVVYIDIYNQNNTKVCECVVDAVDFDKVRYKKWRLSHSHVVTGQPSKKCQRDMSHIILDIPKELDSITIVDHIDCNPLNNRLSNLRICTQSENCMNRTNGAHSQSGFVGVHYNKERNRYEPEIQAGRKRCHLGRYKKLEEAVFARYVAELILFKKFANKKESKDKEAFTTSLSVDTKKKIASYVIDKLHSNNLGN